LVELVDASETEAIERLCELTDLPAAWARVLAPDRRLRLLRVEDAGDESVPTGFPLAVMRRFPRSLATTEDDESSRRSLRRIELAAFLHDAGKAHRAFKLWLYGGDELAAAGPALAKSGRGFLPSRARQLAGLPPDARHEVASIAFAEAHPRLRDAHDPELVLW